MELLGTEIVPLGTLTVTLVLGVGDEKDNEEPVEIDVTVAFKVVGANTKFAVRPSLNLALPLVTPDIIALVPTEILLIFRPAESVIPNTSPPVMRTVPIELRTDAPVIIIPPDPFTFTFAVTEPVTGMLE